VLSLRHPALRSARLRRADSLHGMRACPFSFAKEIDLTSFFFELN
jgi:hypothetical protein